MTYSTERMVDLSPQVVEAFEELRRARAMTRSDVLTVAAGRNLIRAMIESGFDEHDGAVLAFRAVALGNQMAARDGEE